MASREFDTGATRDSEEEKHDPEGFLSPLALNAFFDYMHRMRSRENGEIRDSDNWQLGMSKEVYMKSLVRHMFDVWNNHRGWPSHETIEDGLCGIIFNAQGMLHEIQKNKLRKG